MKIALAQMKNEGTIEKNLQKSISLIKEAAENNADIILFPEVQLTDFFPQYEKKDAWQYRLRIDSDEVKAIQTTCKENNIMAIAMCNRVGAEGEMDFSGESIVVDACGNVIAKANDIEQILYVDVDMQESNKVRKGKPYTNLRRVDLYK